MYATEKKKLEIRGHVKPMSNTPFLPPPPKKKWDRELLKKEKKRKVRRGGEKKLFLIGMCVWSMHTYICICMHAHPSPFQVPSTLFHATNTNEQHHTHPHTHVSYTIPHPQTSYLAASPNSPTYIFAYFISQRRVLAAAAAAAYIHFPPPSPSPKLPTQKKTYEAPHTQITHFCRSFSF